MTSPVERLCQIDFKLSRANLDARCGLGAARNPRLDRGGRAMMRDVDADDDAASTASSLDDLPGPDEFLATAIQKLALKVTPERASPGGGARGHSGSPAGASRDGSERVRQRRRRDGSVPKGVGGQPAGQQRPAREEVIRPGLPNRERTRERERERTRENERERD